MTAAIEAVGVDKRYGRRLALSNCDLQIPGDRVVGLVGPNGAGKSTLLQLAVGLISPTSGSISVLGENPKSRGQVSKIGYVAQEGSTYARISINDHLNIGQHMNPSWDMSLATARIKSLDLDPSQKAGKLSGGQRAQLVLTMALAKRPELLILDEPVASLDPLARKQFLQSLMGYVAEFGTSVVLSSHLLSDLERTCQHLVVLVNSKVRIEGDIDELRTTHHRITGPRRDSNRLPASQTIIEEQHTDRQSSYLIRTSEPIHDPAWTQSPVELEELILAYMNTSGADQTAALKTVESTS